MVFHALMQNQDLKISYKHNKESAKSSVNRNADAAVFFELQSRELLERSFEI